MRLAESHRQGELRKGCRRRSDAKGRRSSHVQGEPFGKPCQRLAERSEAATSRWLRMRPSVADCLRKPLARREWRNDWRLNSANVALHGAHVGSLTQAFSVMLAIRGAYGETGNVDLPLTTGEPRPVMPDTLCRWELGTACRGGRA